MAEGQKDFWFATLWLNAHSRNQTSFLPLGLPFLFLTEIIFFEVVKDDREVIEFSSALSGFER